MTSILSRGPVLVTGGGGFIGANLVRRLVSLDCQVHLIWKKSTNPWRIKELLPKVTLHQVDLLDRPQLKILLEKIRPVVIYHLAAHGSYPNQTNLDQIMTTNILGTLNLLSASQQLSYQCFVNTGTSSEYGVKREPMSEEDVCQPVSFYAATKLSATILTQVFTKLYNKPVVTFRPFSVYGPYEEPTRFIPTIIQSLIEKKAIKLPASEIRHDFIYVDDIIEAYIKAPSKMARLTGQICNLGTGKESTNLQVVRTLFEIAQQQVPIKKGAYPKRAWDSAHWVADISQTKKLLNWKSKFSLENGLNKTLTWSLANKSLYEGQ